MHYRVTTFLLTGIFFSSHYSGTSGYAVLRQNVSNKMYDTGVRAIANMTSKDSMRQIPPEQLDQTGNMEKVAGIHTDTENEELNSGPALSSLGGTPAEVDRHDGDGSMNREKRQFLSVELSTADILPNRALIVQQSVTEESADPDDVIKSRGFITGLVILMVGVVFSGVSAWVVHSQGKVSRASIRSQWKRDIWLRWLMRAREMKRREANKYLSQTTDDEHGRNGYTSDDDWQDDDSGEYRWEYEQTESQGDNGESEYNSGGGMKENGSEAGGEYGGHDVNETDEAGYENTQQDGGDGVVEFHRQSSGNFDEIQKGKMYILKSEDNHPREKTKDNTGTMRAGELTVIIDGEKYGDMKEYHAAADNIRENQNQMRKHEATAQVGYVIGNIKGHNSQSRGNDLQARQARYVWRNQPRNHSRRQYGAPGRRSNMQHHSRRQYGAPGRRANMQHRSDSAVHQAGNYSREFSEYLRGNFMRGVEEGSRATNAAAQIPDVRATTNLQVEKKVQPFEDKPTITPEGKNQTMLSSARTRNRGYMNEGEVDMLQGISEV